MFKDDNWYINNPPFFSFNSTPDFLNSIVNENYSLNVTKNLYTKWLERIVGIIKDRNEKINKWLEKNNNLVLR